MQSNPNALIGLITDVHFDGSSAASDRLSHKISLLNAGPAETLVLMGDLVNGTDEPHAKRMLREVSDLCHSFKGHVYFMPGNHDLDHLSKSDFYAALGRAGDSACFHFESGGYRFICIDGNFSPDGTEYCAGNFQWPEAFVPDEQLNWLHRRLEESVLPVILISHQRVDKACRFAVRNGERVRSMIAASGGVKAVFQGHNHMDDLVEAAGTTYYTLGAHVDDAGPAMLELTPNGVHLNRDFQTLETRSDESPA